MSVLRVNNLTKKFGSFTAVDNISFSLKEGEILGFLGPNGAGKTTTIQMLLAMLTPTSGEIAYFGKDLSCYREEILEKVNFSSTYVELPWRFTVRENLQVFSHFYQIKDRKQRIKKIIDIFRLSKLINQEMHELSAGQKTRVNLAKAFINFPKVLLLDEPTASLDPDAASYVRDFLIKERNKFKMSIIFTSHNMAEVEEVCDRVIFIDRGKIVADDTPENLAKSMKICHLKLMIKDGLKRTIEETKKQFLPYKVEGRYIVIDIKEKQLPNFLKSLIDRNIIYDEISIDKPTLEDYFIERTKTL